MRNDLNISVQQTQHLSQKMLQSLKILQMDAAEINEYLENELEENPLLQREESAAMLSSFEPFPPFSAVRKNTAEPDAEDDPILRVPARAKGFTLRHHLCDQLETSNAPEPIRTLCRYLIDLLDENGRLHREDYRDVCAPCGVLEAALALLRSFDPPGVGAENAVQCLLLQLDRLPGRRELEKRLLCEHLDALARRQYSRIAKALRVPEREVIAAGETIRTLTPYPAADFPTDDLPGYICPDATVGEEDGILRIELNRRTFPHLSVVAEYESLLAGDIDAETRRYLTRNLAKATWLIDTLSQREKTFLKCLCYIAGQQKEYLLGRSDELPPLSLAQIAKAVSLHESTVSRTIAGKYILTQRGCLPLKRLLVRKLNNGPISNQQVLCALKALVEKEDPVRPLSDQRLAEELCRAGYPVSRRTVVKYRNLLDIPCSALRQAFPPEGAAASRPCRASRPSRSETGSDPKPETPRKTSSKRKYNP